MAHPQQRSHALPRTPARACTFARGSTRVCVRARVCARARAHVRHAEVRERPFYLQCSAGAYTPWYPQNHVVPLVPLVTPPGPQVTSWRPHPVQPHVSAAAPTAAAAQPRRAASRHPSVRVEALLTATLLRRPGSPPARDGVSQCPFLRLPPPAKAARCPPTKRLRLSAAGTRCVRLYWPISAGASAGSPPQSRPRGPRRSRRSTPVSGHWAVL